MKIFELDIKARAKSDPDIEYEKVPKKKSEPDIIDSVVAHLKGSKSAFFTKIARRFDRAARIKKLLAAEEKSLKKETLDAVGEIFDAGDEVYTRVVETASLVFKIAKSGDKTVDKLDEAGYLKELEELTGLAVGELEAIRQKHTKPVTNKVLPKVLAPTEKKTESINEGMYEKVKHYASLVTQKVQSFLRRWDSRFASVKSKIESQI